MYRSSEDNKWFGILLQRYTLLLLGVAMKYLKNRTLAEDAVQQVFLKSLTSLPEEDIHNFKGWLYILTRNHCLQLLRNQPNYPIEITAIQVAEEVAEQENEILATCTPEKINAALEYLSEEQKQSIVLFYLEKMSYQQIMEQTGYNFMQVKSYIQNGKRNLKQILMKQLKND